MNKYPSQVLFAVYLCRKKLALFIILLTLSVVSDIPKNVLRVNPSFERVSQIHNWPLGRITLHSCTYSKLADLTLCHVCTRKYCITVMLVIVR
jgi:hypothetical protein